MWQSETVIECADCGAVVDPYVWIRARCHDWHQMLDHIQDQEKQAKAELEKIKKSLRLLRKEYESEVEKKAVESAVMILPPKRSIRADPD